MTAPVGPNRALCAAADRAGHRVERMLSPLERYGFGSEDEPPGPA